MLEQYETELDNDDANLEYLKTFDHLQWLQNGSFCRLPAGATPGCSSICSDNCEDEDCMIPTCLPVKRPVCVLFDKVDSLERDLEISTYSSSKTTQTSFADNKFTQTDYDYTFYRSSQMQDEYTQYEEINLEEVSKSKKKEEKQSEESTSYYISSDKRTADFSAPIAPKQSNVLHKIHFWRRNLLKYPHLATIENRAVPKVDSGEKRENIQLKEQDDLLKLVTDINQKLNDLMLKFDRQETEIKQLQSEVKSLKLPKESTKKSETKLRTSEEAKALSESLSRSNNRHTKVDFAVESTPLQNRKSSDCQLCSAQNLPVLNELIGEVLRLIEQRNFEDVMLTVLLRADNVYHVNVKEKYTSRNLGCVLVTHEGITSAINEGFFNEILTYTVTDQRNTIQSKDLSFGIPFEYVSAENDAQKSAKEQEFISKSTTEQEFITTVLRMPANNI